jgi:hypothetical protein
MRVRVFTLVVVAALAFALPASAQAPTGTILGHVVSADGQPLPGVTVSAVSANLQGTRTTVTSANGDYLIPLLPPGDYTLTFEIGSVEPMKETRSVAGTQNAIVNAKMSLAGVNETVTVVGDAQTFSETAHVATNFKQSLMAALPSNRTIDAVLLMAPALHATGPRGAYTINGSQSYENLFTLDGAVVTENLRGQPFTLYIEDALQEITVSSAGISAEYGRFEGGVANAITKSGGNIFSGSFRTSFANDSWRTFTPFETTQLIANPSLKLKLDKTVPTYEFTMGGPIVKERLWFFSAARKQNQEVTRTTAGTNIPYTRSNNEKRYEGKLTYNLGPGHSLQGSYLAMDQVLENNTSQNVMDLQSLTNQGQPQSLYSVHYTGVIHSKFFLEAQYSARALEFTNTGSSKTDEIGGTLVLDIQNGRRYWSPTFCSGSVCSGGNEQRNNADFIVKASYFLSDRRTGSHHLVFGYDRFLDMMKQNTHSSGSDFRIRGTSSIVRDGVVYPQFLANTFIDYNPIAKVSEGTHLRTHSLFVNDNWRANGHLSFNLGLRTDTNDGTDGGGQKVGAGTTLSPRISAIWDPKADGTWALTSSYARYVVSLNPNLAGSSTEAGNVATYRWAYGGPLINPEPNVANLVTTEEALATVFAWFKSIDGTDNKNYVSATVPGVNMKIPTPLHSPFANEYAAGVSRTLGARGTARVDAVFREYKNFYTLRTDMSTGRVSDKFGNPFDLSVIENADSTERRYRGLVTQATYNFARGIALGGNYTLSHTFGNLEGETVGGGPSGASIGSYPEYKRMSWNAPQGDLLIDQRHRARIWGTYVLPLSALKGPITLGLVQQYASGVPYGAVGIINPSPFVQNPGYVTPPTQIEYYFTARDAYHTKPTYRTDLSVNYAYRLPHTGAAQPEVFFHGEILNAFNQFQLCGCGDSVFNNGGVSNLTKINQAVRVIAGAPFNPFTSTPVLGVNYDIPAATFGSAIDALAWTSPRIIRFSVGVRF